MKPWKILALTAILATQLLLPGASASAGEPVLRMATTTSTDNTGLLDYLAPLFQKDTGIKLQWVAVGTGKALALGRNCDVSILFVHAPAAEKKFVKEGYGITRRKVMYNDFVIIGPKNDPARLKGLSIPTALKAVTGKNAVFVSRGDDSGTHKKELSLWKAASLQLPDKKKWYIQTGQGMLTTIKVAEERSGYTLVDRGTYIKYESQNQGNPRLVILVEGDKSLMNQYSIIAINPESCDKAAYNRTLGFIGWITAPKAQKHIADFRLLGKQLFIPNAEQ
ncbi:MAG: substrate-binding domain-containing protein [Deltaproteobacteria bacterium]|nr:substrate-binding domain-containing protein [Deltaproteobacteria bacterium]MBW2051179.1 substrate-binding domain-containing protein [Deltaproteobacteria bacterium]MBW2140487.1 substrate-binding domain-containing protein [Deltaproteobacteria bacterium]MBW2322205.1 substrate-binding domain-containing protein [Deltaproteobacteria bacterium]